MRRILYDLEVMGPKHLVATTITLPIDVKNKVTENFWSYKEIVMLGIMAKENNPQLITRIKELESGNAKLQSQLTRLATKVLSLGGDLND